MSFQHIYLGMVIVAFAGFMVALFGVSTWVRLKK